MPKKLTVSLREYANANNLKHLINEFISIGELTPDTIGFSSLKEVDWICEYGHREHESPNKRVRRGFCSACGKERKGSLAQNHPELLKYWSSKNKISPEEVPPTYSPLVIWHCDKGHEWKRTVKCQLKVKSCPVCSREKNTLFKNHPELREEWDYEKNKNVNPELVQPYSNTKYYWICKNGHSYMAAPEKLMRKSMRCPICNSFGYNRQDILDEWHPTKNGDKTPFDFPENSNKNAWFVCKECHSEYESRIQYRAKRTSPNCPNCRNNKESNT